MELREVTAGYGGADVVKGISLRFQPGEVTVLAGPNGCGKSTLLRAAARLLPLSGGQVLVDGADTAGWSSRTFARQAALLPQSRPMPEITVEALVLHGRFPYLGYPRRYGPADRAAARSAMERAGVLELAERNVARLSGGQRQKVYLAMALAQDTPVLLLDEPTTFLDIGCQLELARLMRETAAEGKAVVMVLHDLNLALGCAHRVAVMEEGRLRAWGTPAEIYAGGALEQVFGVKVHRTELEDGTEQYLFTRRGPGARKSAATSGRRMRDETSAAGSQLWDLCGGGPGPGSGRGGAGPAPCCPGAPV